VKIMDLALKNGAPVIGLNDSGGARIQEGVVSLGGYADIFLRNTLASGVVPQISAILGPCAGGAVYSPAITDFVYMVRGTSYMFVTGPNVVKTVTHETSTWRAGRRGRARGTSGVAHFAMRQRDGVPRVVRTLLRFLPQNNREDPPRRETDDPHDRADEELLDIVPDEPNRPYDMHDVIRRVVDDGEFYEVHRDYAGNIVGFAHLGGHAVGIVANQPAVLAGVLDINSGEGRALRPLLRRLQHPAGGVRGRARLPAGRGAGARRHHPPRREAAVRVLRGDRAALTVITRKAYGGAYDVMNSKHIRGDINLAWPTAEIAVMGPKGAVEILFRREIAAAEDPAAATAEREAEYREQFAHPYIAAARGYIDDVIDPRETRPRLISALDMLRNKRDSNPPRKHGNIPL
jgi:propionyl-CoA carboxylase beta chain